MISERTKIALAAAKRRGERLGNPTDAAKRGTAAVKANARRFAANVRPIIDEIIAAGAMSHNAIAAKLNERNVRTARGGAWTHAQAGAILHPFAGAGAAMTATYASQRGTPLPLDAQDTIQCLVSDTHQHPAT